MAVSFSIQLKLMELVKQKGKEIKELGNGTNDPFAEGAIRMLKKVQGRDWERIMRLHIKVNESDLSIKEKHLFVGNMELDMEDAAFEVEVKINATYWNEIVNEIRKMKCNNSIGSVWEYRGGWASDMWMMPTTDANIIFSLEWDAKGLMRLPSYRKCSPFAEVTRPGQWMKPSMDAIYLNNCEVVAAVILWMPSYKKCGSYSWSYGVMKHEGYRNTIKLPVGNKMVPLPSDTIQLVQNGCSFHELRSEDPNQHLKDFLKLVDSLDLDGENRERTRLRLFQFSILDQASNWLERLPAGSITTCEDLTTRFLAQFFPPGRTAKLRNDILMFQQHHGESNSKAWTHFKETPSSWHRILAPKDLSLYDNKRWNDPRDFAKSVKAITLPQDVPSTSDRRLIELENQVQRLMEAHLAPMKPTQVNKVTTSYEICSGPHNTQYCMEDPEQAFVEYASSRTDEAGEGLVSNFMASQDARLSKFEADFKQQQSEMTNQIDTVLKAITDRLVGSLPSDTVKNLKLNINSTTSFLSTRSYPTIDPQCSSHPSTLINAIKTCSTEANISQTSQLQTWIGIGTQQPEEPEPTLEDEL
ncbi:MAK10-like protein [Tanacetum coccineum]|uniref:MAK10-like protein n=1 Tax=Tanacetum coccineum TaxID=301880 RepID=A0ABQ5D5U2_9ASTR